MEGGGVKIIDNHDDHNACLKGRFSDPSLVRIFQQAGFTIPKPHWRKKITDERLSLGDEPRAALTADVLDAHIAAAAAAAAPPEGTGASVAPVLPSS